jgi:hypothetical protein
LVGIIVGEFDGVTVGCNVGWDVVGIEVGVEVVGVNVGLAVVGATEGMEVVGAIVGAMVGISIFNPTIIISELPVLETELIEPEEI